MSSKAQLRKHNRLKPYHGNGGKQHEEDETIDYKMVTFSLGGKDYAVDILDVKEIANLIGVTPVPNTPAYVAGVYNLRGEIISIVDLRIMFGLPAEERSSGEPRRGLILRLNDTIIGIIVDYVDQVVGVDSSRIQPPHPIFGDINIKYISGVVEKNERLYIVLDVERIFGRESQEAEARRRRSAETEGAELAGAPAEETHEAPESIVAQRAAEARNQHELDLIFIKEELTSLVQFYPSALNNDWLASRYEDWRKERTAAEREVQLACADDAHEFLAPFYSRDTGRFWSSGSAGMFREILPERLRNTITVWNPGAGKGFESYSLACLLKKVYPESTLKIWASDNDLLSISTAPNLVFREEEVPSTYHEFVVEGKNGYTLAGMIKDSVLFEYHDITHPNVVPEMDLIVARDVLSCLPPERQASVLDEFYDKLLEHGIVIVGDHETGLAPDRWERIDGSRIAAFRKRKQEKGA